MHEEKEEEEVIHQSLVDERSIREI